MSFIQLGGVFSTVEEPATKAVTPESQTGLHYSIYTSSHDFKHGRTR